MDPNKTKQSLPIVKLLSASSKLLSASSKHSIMAATLPITKHPLMHRWHTLLNPHDVSTHHIASLHPLILLFLAENCEFVMFSLGVWCILTYAICRCTSWATRWYMRQIKFCRHKSLRFYPPFVFITTFRAWIRCTPSDLSSSFQAKPLVLFFSSLVIILLSGKHELSPYLCPSLTRSNLWRHGAQCRILASLASC